MVDLTPDDVFEILSHPYRRYILAYLDQQRRPIALDDLIDKIAAWDEDKAIPEIDDECLRQVSLSLYHTHLPKLVDAGLINVCQKVDTYEIELVSSIEPLKPTLMANLDEDFQQFYTT